MLMGKIPEGHCINFQGVREINSYIIIDRSIRLENALLCGVFFFSFSNGVIEFLEVGFLWYGE